MSEERKTYDAPVVGAGHIGCSVEPLLDPRSSELAALGCPVQPQVDLLTLRPSIHPLPLTILSEYAAESTEAHSRGAG